MELKNVLETLGLEGVKDLEAFKEKFQSKFITKDEAFNDEEIKGKITGKIAGAATTLIKRHFELENAEIKDKKWEEVLEIGVSKLKNSLKELEGKAGQTNDEALKDYQAKLEKANKTISDFKEQNETLKTGLETSEKTWSEKYLGLKKNNVLESAKSRLLPKLREMTELERVGFEAAIKNNINIDFDEKDEIYVKGIDGKRIPNPNKMGAFLSLDEALELEAVKGNVIKKNNAGQQNPGLFQAPIKQDNNTSPDSQNGRKIHPNALKNMELLKAQAEANK